MKTLNFDSPCNAPTTRPQILAIRNKNRGPEVPMFAPNLMVGGFGEHIVSMWCPIVSLIHVNYMLYEVSLSIYVYIKKHIHHMTPLYRCYFWRIGLKKKVNFRKQTPTTPSPAGFTTSLQIRWMCWCWRSSFASIGHIVCWQQVLMF